MHFFFLYVDQHPKECRDYQDFFSAKSDSFSSQLYFHYISRKITSLPTNNLENVNLSSDEEFRSSSQALGANQTYRDEEVLETIENMSLGHQQLFFHLFSTILGLVQNDVISKEHNCCVSYLEKCFTFLSLDTAQNPNQMLSWYHYYGLNHLYFVLLNGLSSSKDGLEKILCSTYYANVYAVIQNYVQKVPQPIYLFLSFDSFSHITTCLLQTMNLFMASSCHNSDLLKLISKFIQLNYTDLLKKILIELGTSFQDDSNIIVKQCFERAEVVIKQLAKISKQVKCMKGYCDEHKGQSTSLAAKIHIKESSKSVSRKQVSSDEEPPQKPGKQFNNSNNQSEESAENFSDIHDLLFDESSDSGVERRIKEKNTNKKAIEMSGSRKGT